MKHELLCPAGDMASLEEAVANGADAVYLACKSFGARKFAENFTNKEIIKAINLCHLYGVKIYVTMNTLVKDNEVGMFLGQVEFLYKNGVDALLIQDFGMICLVREKYPDLDIHASTQANTSAKETAELFYKLGVKRIVFSRELSLAEIESIKVPIEKEVFIHGALCISYSGCCLLSSMIGGRSGNRGECAGSCRMLYSLKRGERMIVENKYLLSTKELNTASRFKELLDSGIYSFKIEGRMKSPEYVGFITRYYRNLIDNYGNVFDLEEKTNELKTLYNREFTVGRLFNASDEEIMNIESPNHIGLEIGKVISVTPQKIKIKLDRVLNQQDGIRFLKSGKGFIVNYLYDEQGKYINSADDICYVDNKIDLKENDIVCKTLDYKLMNELRVLPKRKVPIRIEAVTRIGQPFTVTMNDGVNSVKVSGSPVEVAINAVVDQFKIREQLEKLGNTPFESKATVVECDDNIFINIKEINEIRRILVEKLVEVRIKVAKPFNSLEVSLQPPNIKSEPTITCSVGTLEQLEACNRLNVERIYVEKQKLYNDFRSFDNIYFHIPRNRLIINEFVERKNLISEYFEVNDTFDNVGDYGLNVSNIYTAYYLYKMGVNPVTLSVELTEDEIINFINTYVKVFKSYPNIEIIGYGPVENMIIKGNILNIKENDMTYTLIDGSKRSFPVYFDGVNTHVINFEKKELKNLEVLKKYASIRLIFFDEDEKTVKNVIAKFR